MSNRAPLPYSAPSYGVLVLITATTVLAGFLGARMNAEASPEYQELWASLIGVLSFLGSVAAWTMARHVAQGNVVKARIALVLVVGFAVLSGTQTYTLVSSMIGNLFAVKEAEVASTEARTDRVAAAREVLASAQAAETQIAATLAAKIEQERAEAETGCRERCLALRAELRALERDQAAAQADTRKARAALVAASEAPPPKQASAAAVTAVQITPLMALVMTWAAVIMIEAGAGGLPLLLRRSEPDAAEPATKADLDALAERLSERRELVAPVVTAPAPAAAPTPPAPAPLAPPFTTTTPSLATSTPSFVTSTRPTVPHGSARERPAVEPPGFGRVEIVGDGGALPGGLKLETTPQRPPQRPSRPNGRAKA